MSQPIYLVDAFASKTFTGNPAAVCPLDGPADETWMAQLAMEMNQAETAYCYPEGDGHRLRWFTPEIEVDLCGHATLATAHVLWKTGRVTGETIKFETRSGTLTCTRSGDQITMDFPALEVTPADRFEAIRQCLGFDVLGTYESRFDLLVELESEARLRGLSPNLSLLATLPYRGVIVTAQSQGDQDFVSRFFAPGAGVPEDPVTGSAHCVLGPFWASRLGKNSLVGYQASRRGGFVGVQVQGDRVLLTGKAFTTLVGTLQ